MPQLCCPHLARPAAGQKWGAGTVPIAGAAGSDPCAPRGMRVAHQRRHGHGQLHRQMDRALQSGELPHLCRPQYRLYRHRDHLAAGALRCGNRRADGHLRHLIRRAFSGHLQSQRQQFGGQHWIAGAGQYQFRQRPELHLVSGGDQLSDAALWHGDGEHHVRRLHGGHQPCGGNHYQCQPDCTASSTI